uniref:Sushi domain containing 4 n=1 Tax=Astyanax mexicanus TaxID=7994 RepID=A0A8B9GSD6_ASTMX
MSEGTNERSPLLRVSLSPLPTLSWSLLLFLSLLSSSQASSCVRPFSIQHGRVNVTETNRGSFPVGTVLQYSCDSGYTVDGPSIVICTREGLWSSGTPLCLHNSYQYTVDQCNPPLEPENGGYTCHPSPCHHLSQGTVVEYFCDEGYTLKGGQKYLTCQNGEWDHSIQVNCVPTQGCVRQFSIQHGQVNVTETNRGSFPVGTVLQYSCDSGYTVDGPSIVICTREGLWTSGPPRCLHNTLCGPPFEPENGGYTCHPSPCHHLTHGTVVEYFCDEGYTLKGDYKYLTCQNGEWDSAVQISCVLSQEKNASPVLGMNTLSIVASTASSVALVLLLVVLFVLLQPKLKSFHHGRFLSWKLFIWARSGRLRAARDHHGGGRSGDAAIIRGGCFWSWRSCCAQNSPEPTAGVFRSASCRGLLLLLTRSAGRDRSGASASLLFLLLLLLLVSGHCAGGNGSIRSAAAP